MSDDDWPPVKVWLNDEHANGYKPVTMHNTDQIIGIHEWHIPPGGGEWCGGFAAFVEYELEPNWTHTGDAETGEGFTMSPSLLCTACGNHGYIRDGKWVPA